MEIMVLSKTMGEYGVVLVGLFYCILIPLGLDGKRDLDGPE